MWLFFDTNSNVCASESETCRPNLSTRLKGNSKTLGAGECVHRFGILRRRKSLARWNKVSLIGREGSLPEGSDRLDRERFARCMWVRDCLNSELIAYREKRCLLGVGQSGEIELWESGKGGFQPKAPQALRKLGTQSMTSPSQPDMTDVRKRHFRKLSSDSLFHAHRALREGNLTPRQISPKQIAKVGGAMTPANYSTNSQCQDTDKVVYVWTRTKREMN